MAIQLINKGGAVPELICLNADIASLPTVNIPIGSSCWVRDTGSILKFDGTGWYSFSQPTSITGSLVNLPVELKMTDLMNQVLLASAARTIMTSSPVVSMTNGRGILVSINITVASGTGGIAPRLMCIDQAGRAYYGDLTPTAVTVVGRYSYVIYPTSLSASLGSYAKVTQGIVTPSFMIRVEPSDGSSYTYSVEVEELR